MIYITGDIHGDYDIKKLGFKTFPESRKLTRKDYLIICGDFGLLWDNSKTEKYWLSWLDSKPWTTLWIDGNHENFDMLKEYPTESWKGGKIQKITENIFHLCRGNVFEIERKKFFAFGGAESHDKQFRTYGESIWEEELPSHDELKNGINSLRAVGNSVDIVITHSLPNHIQKDIFPEKIYPSNILTEYFDEIENIIDFKYWFSGHYHISAEYDKKHYLIYDNIIRLTDTGFERIYPLDKNTKYIDKLPDKV